jgi:hypothetical protein
LNLCGRPRNNSGGAKPGSHAPRDAGGLGARDVAARDRRQHGAQSWQKILHRPQ